MRNNGLFFMALDGGSPYNFPLDPIGPHSFGGHLLSQINSFVDNSRYLYVPGSRVVQEAFTCISKFAGAFLFSFVVGANSTIRDNLPGNSHGSNPSKYKSATQVKRVISTQQNLLGFRFNFGLKGESSNSIILGNIPAFVVGQLFNQAEQLQSFPFLSLAAALVPPLDNVCPNVLAVSLEDSIQMQRCMDQSPCQVEHRGCSDISFSELNWTRHAVEPRTGIEFPTILDNILARESNSSLMSEVLVGTGSKNMTIIKIKSLKVYAFGFYVHPYDVCQKLGPKYASTPLGDLKKRHDFYEDLLRQDINMTVRLVVNCNGMKINTVKNTLEKSLRPRLVKANPDTDYHCLKAFGSLFKEDVMLHSGTTIDFRQTADGQLITEMDGSQIGAVHSKDLCRAFFDMYIGDGPVSEQTKEEIGRNVASIITRC